MTTTEFLFNFLFFILLLILNVFTGFIVAVECVRKINETLCHGFIFMLVFIWSKFHFQKSLMMMMTTMIFAPCHISSTTTKVPRKRQRKEIAIRLKTDWTKYYKKKLGDLLCTALLCVENLLYLCIHFNWNHSKMLIHKLKHNASFVYFLLEILCKLILFPFQTALSLSLCRFISLSVWILTASCKKYNHAFQFVILHTLSMWMCCFIFCQLTILLWFDAAIKCMCILLAINFPLSNLSIQFSNRIQRVFSGLNYYET